MIATGSEDGYPGSVDAERLLYGLARMFERLQQDLDLHGRALARDLRESGAPGFSLAENRIVRSPGEAGGGASSGVLPLPSMVPNRTYRIAGLTIEFQALREDLNPPNGRCLLRAAPREPGAAPVHRACIAVNGDGQVVAELQFGEEIRKTLVLGSRQGGDDGSSC